MVRLLTQSLQELGYECVDTSVHAILLCCLSLFIVFCCWVWPQQTCPSPSPACPLTLLPILVRNAAMTHSQAPSLHPLLQFTTTHIMLSHAHTRQVSCPLSQVYLARSCHNIQLVRNRHDTGSSPISNHPPPPASCAGTLPTSSWPNRVFRRSKSAGATFAPLCSAVTGV